MASKEINDFTEQTSINTTDEMLLQETSGGTTKKTLFSTIISKVLGAVTNLSSKSSVVSADQLLINDSADSNNPKKVSVGVFGLVPAGVTLPFAGSGTIPTGYFLCDGTAVSRTTYSGLFTAIGTTYGVGDGSTTFNVPDFRGQFLRGYESGVSEAIGTAQDDAMQKITGTFEASGLIATVVAPTGTGALIPGTSTARTIANSTGSTTTAAIDFDSSASTSPNTAKTDDVETRPKNFAVQYIIKT